MNAVRYNDGLVAFTACGNRWLVYPNGKVVSDNGYVFNKITSAGTRVQEAYAKAVKTARNVTTH